MVCQCPWRLCLPSCCWELSSKSQAGEDGIRRDMDWTHVGRIKGECVYDLCGGLIKVV